MENLIDTELAAEYLLASDQLSAAKAREKELRLEICSRYFNERGNKSHSDQIDNYKIKVGYKINTKIDQESMAEDYDGLEDEERNCIKIKYDLKKKEYKNLEDTSAIDTYISEEPAMPTLSIEYVTD